MARSGLPNATVRPMIFFKNVPNIKFEGPKSTGLFTFRHYNEEEIVEGKSMREHLRFSVVYWHTFRNRLSDPFGAPTAIRPWDDGTDSIKNAQKRARVAFELSKRWVP